jgi:tRNA pseudouridine65 synthase
MKAFHARASVPRPRPRRKRLPGRREPRNHARVHPVDFLYVDEHLAVVHKPTGLSVHRGWDDDRDVMMFRVRDALGGQHVHPVHRLDRGTSGALVLARSSEAAAALAARFEAHAVEKSYLALVRGRVAEDAFEIDYAIPRREGGERVPAHTSVRVLARSEAERCSLVRALPRSGRLHQIRRHLRHVHHPLVGDVRYGDGAVNRLYRARYGLHRLALHAERLAFEHPFGGARVDVRAPLPPELAHAFERLFGTSDFVAADVSAPTSAPAAAG